jgi:hypothetical protein
MCKRAILELSKSLQFCPQITSPCPICLDSLTFPISLPWIHSFCHQCLLTHIRAKLFSGQILNIPCPSCSQVISPTVILQITDHPTSQKYQELKQKMEDFKSEGNEEEAEIEYERVAINLQVQLWPKWGEFVSKAKMCNHLACEKWFYRFCIYWRGKYTKNHMNPLNANAWPSLLKQAKGKLTSRIPALVNNSWVKLLCILFLLLMISPLTTLMLFPYITYRNFKASWFPEQRKCRRIWKSIIMGWILILVILWFPITWIITVLFHFYIFWKMIR